MLNQVVSKTLTRPVMRAGFVYPPPGGFSPTFRFTRLAPAGFARFRERVNSNVGPLAKQHAEVRNDHLGSSVVRLG